MLKIKKKLNILIVDDAKVNRYILLKYINKNSGNYHSIYEASSGQIAIEISKTVKLDVVFMDIRMPVMDGIEATKLIKKEYPEVLVYGTTGQVEKGVMEECKKAGMLTCIGKPIQIHDIQYILESINNS